MEESTQVIDINEIIVEQDPLKIDLDDTTFANVMDSLITESRNFFRKDKDLYNRRKKNETYYLGRQLQQMEKDGSFKPYNARYSDNIIYEAEGTQKAVAVSRVPDLIITPGTDDEQGRQVADELTKAVNNRMRKRETRKILGRAYRHRSLYFTGVLKCVWDSERGPHGDYKFVAVHPNDIDVDQTALDNDVKNMDWIAHHYELSIKEILMRWPKKRKDLFNELGWDESMQKDEKRLASKVKISEIWFTWYKEENGEWVKLEGVGWKYKKVVFDKKKNPYWDWDGETQMFVYDNELGKQPVGEDMLRQSMLTGMPLNMQMQEVYHNHFENPSKPFFFLGHEQLGMGPYDETSRIEQAIPLEDNVNVRGKQITEINAGAKGKNIWAEESGLDANDVEEIDMNDPEQDILIKGDVGKAHRHIPGQQAGAALFQEQNMNRERIFSIMGTNDALRGVRGGENTATQTQLFKESDFTKIDDEVEDTINAAGEWMADWAMQMIRLFYTENHFEKIAGETGSVLFITLQRDMVQDGMAVEVSASSVDKLKRRNEAFELARLNMIDPVQFFRDIEMSDPEGRAEQVMLYNMSPELYMQKFVLGNDTEAMAGQLGQINQQQLGGVDAAGQQGISIAG